MERSRAIGVAWIAVQLGLVAHGLLGGRWAWDMFSDPPAEERTVVVEARVAGGPWERLPVDGLFRYHRGATGRGVLDEARAIEGPGRWRERRAFVAWAVHELRPGTPFVEARLSVVAVGTRHGRTTTRELGTFRLTP